MKGLTFKTTGTWFYFDDSREFFKGDYIVATGRIVKTAGPELALELEERGYDWIKAELGE